jgi:hypothetical protein
MADHYTQFSFALELEQEARDKAKALYKRLLQAMGIESDLDDPIHPVKDDLTAKAVDLADGMDEWLGFLVSLDKNGLWIRNDGDSGSPEHAAAFVQVVLQMLELDAIVTFSWADTCSKLCLDSFGGGAVAITRHATDWLNTHAWCEQMTRIPNPKLDADGPMITEYVQKLGLCCPVCDSDAIKGGSVEINAGCGTQEVDCDNCQSTWVDTYTLDGFTELHYGPCALCSQTVFEHGKTVSEGGLFCSPSCAEAATEREVSHG